MVDIGGLLESSPAQPSNRTTLSVVPVKKGDLIQFPNGVTWDPAPNYVPNPEFFLAASTMLSRKKVYISINGTDVHFEGVDDHTFRVGADGIILVEAYDKDDFYSGLARSHRISVDTRGHVLIDPDPIPAAAVINYGTGEQLDVSGAQQIGAVPPPAGGFLFTRCDAHACFLSYQGPSLPAPTSGTIQCVSNDAYDFITPAYRIQFRQLHTGATVTPASACVAHAVAAGDALTDGFAHWEIRASTPAGDPLSIVSAGDGAIYLGTVAHTLDCPPCRGN